MNITEFPGEYCRTFESWSSEVQSRTCTHAYDIHTLLFDKVQTVSTQGVTIQEVKGEGGKKGGNIDLLI